MVMHGFSLIQASHSISMIFRDVGEQIFFPLRKIGSKSTVQIALSMSICGTLTEVSSDRHTFQRTNASRFHWRC